ncbi:uncharacterized protein V6R79_020000, partial [Siganus canaliculatus]
AQHNTLAASTQAARVTAADHHNQLFQLLPINTLRLSGFALSHLILRLIIVERCSKDSPIPQHLNMHKESHTTVCDEQSKSKCKQYKA